MRSGWDVKKARLWCGVLGGGWLERELICEEYLLCYRLFTTTLDHLFQCVMHFKKLLSGKVA